MSRLTRSLGIVAGVILVAYLALGVAVAVVSLVAVLVDVVFAMNSPVGMAAAFAAVVVGTWVAGRVLKIVVVLALIIVVGEFLGGEIKDAVAVFEQRSAVEGHASAEGAEPPRWSP